MGPICKAINLIESAWKLFPAEGREGKKRKYNHNTSETWFEMNLTIKPSHTPQNPFTLSNNLSRNCLPRKKGAGVKSCDKNIDIIKCQPPLSWWLSQTKKGYYSKGCARDKRWHCVGKCIPFTSCILQFMRPLSCFRCKHQDHYKMTILAEKGKHFLKSSLNSRLSILSFMKCAMLWQARKKKYKKTFLFWEEGKIYLLKGKLCFFKGSQAWGHMHNRTNCRTEQKWGGREQYFISFKFSMISDFSLILACLYH